MRTRGQRRTVSAMTSIQIHGLTKRFGNVVAVDDLSFEVAQGSVTGFLGPNGAGKTTTLRMLLGLIEPTAGARRSPASPIGSSSIRSATSERSSNRRASTPAAEPETTFACCASLRAYRLQPSRRGPRRGRPRRCRLTAGSRASRSACASGSASPPPCSGSPKYSSSTSPPTASTPRASTGCASSSAPTPTKDAACSYPATSWPRSPRPSTTSSSSPKDAWSSSPRSPI